MTAREDPAKYMREWRARNRERYEAWRLENKEKMNKRAREWNAAHKETANDRSREWQRSIRREVIEAYGSECVCCGEREPRFLTIDHIEPVRKMRRHSVEDASLSSGPRLYKWLKVNGFPKDRFRLLCWNCNSGRKYGPCPHEVSRSRAAMRNVNEVVCNVRIG